jgi:hypothetical protein
MGDNPYKFQTSFGNSAPGLTAPNLAKLGWIPYPQIADPEKPHEYWLSPIEKAASMVLVPIDSPPLHYYTVEYLDPALAYGKGTEWGQKLPGPGVVIHEARTGPNGLFYLLDTGGAPLFQICQSFVGVDNIQITLAYLPNPDDISSLYTQAIVGVGYVGDGVTDPNQCKNAYLNPPPPPPPSCRPGWKWCTTFSPPGCMPIKSCLVDPNRVDPPG